MRSKVKGIGEVGRSMVEMLGVLAIIGVLTVASFWGYRFALDIIMANSIVTGVRARSVIIGQQRVLGIPLNLQEFIEDGQEKDLIFERFEVKAYNDYKNANNASSYQDTAISSCGIDENVQVMEVFDVPYRVCEYIKDLEFVDPTCNAINGRAYMHQNGIVSSVVECIADGPVQEPPTGIYDDGLNREFHNVLTFVFDDGVGMKCSKGMDCPTGCCEEGVCVRHKKGEECDCIGCEESDGEGGCKPKAKGQTCIYPNQAPCCCDGEGNIVNCPSEPPSSSSSGGGEDPINPDDSSSSSGGGEDPTDPDNPDNPDEESCDDETYADAHPEKCCSQNGCCDGFAPQKLIPDMGCSCQWIDGVEGGCCSIQAYAQTHQDECCSQDECCPRDRCCDGFAPQKLIPGTAVCSCQWTEAEEGKCCSIPAYVAAHEDECCSQNGCCGGLAPQKFEPFLDHCSCYWIEHEAGKCCTTYDSYAEANQEECCGYESYAKDNHEECCNYESYVNVHGIACCSSLPYAEAHKEECCADETYAKAHEEECCPDGGTLSETVPGKCCLGTYVWDGNGYDIVDYYACGCPTDDNGNTGTLSTTVSGVCCLERRAWDGDSYDGVNVAACGCPGEGTPSEMIPGTCCWMGYSLYGDEYKAIDPPACGCPLNGEQSETDQDVCCVGPYALKDDKYNIINPTACGCPEEGDGTVGEPSKTVSNECCIGIYSWGGTRYDIVNYYACGCPDGGTPSETDSSVCCSDEGGAWNGASYNGVNVAACGCPEDNNGNRGTESKTVSDVCCSEGYAWGDHGYGYGYNTLYPVACGCPEYSKPSPHGIEYGCCSEFDKTKLDDWGVSGIVSDAVCGCPSLYDGTGRYKGGYNNNDECCGENGKLMVCENDAYYSESCHYSGDTCTIDPNKN